MLLRNVSRCSSVQKMWTLVKITRWNCWCCSKKLTHKQIVTRRHTFSLVIFLKTLTFLCTITDLVTYTKNRQTNCSRHNKVFDIITCLCRTQMMLMIEICKCEEGAKFYNYPRSPTQKSLQRDWKKGQIFLQQQIRY